MMLSILGMRSDDASESVGIDSPAARVVEIDASPVQPWVDKDGTLAEPGAPMQQKVAPREREQVRERADVHRVQTRILFEGFEVGRRALRHERLACLEDGHLAQVRRPPLKHLRPQTRVVGCEEERERAWAGPFLRLPCASAESGRKGEGVLQVRRKRSRGSPGALVCTADVQTQNHGRRERNTVDALGSRKSASLLHQSVRQSLILRLDMEVSSHDVTAHTPVLRPPPLVVDRVIRGIGQPHLWAVLLCRLRGEFEHRSVRPSADRRWLAQLEPDCHLSIVEPHHRQRAVERWRVRAQGLEISRPHPVPAQSALGRRSTVPPLASFGL
mmetsp:Transcript_19004/g.61952  ORF Transcript_19004/g.61952 Transcript_19004/m.61952 type:complete len:329 (+) Transcript_19004:3-989(+)